MADLSASRTNSGLKLGASAVAVVKTLIVRACGMERYEYTRVREGAPDELDFTISNGRVIEIFSTLGG